MAISKWDFFADSCVWQVKNKYYKQTIWKWIRVCMLKYWKATFTSNRYAIDFFYQGLPLLPCLAYAVLRLTLDDTMCWALPSEAVWVEGVYMVPGLLCILINAAFFANIFRILVTKLQAPPANEPANYRYYRKWTKYYSTLPHFSLLWLACSRAYHIDHIKSY